MLNQRANCQCGKIKNDGNKRPYNTIPHFYILGRTSTRNARFKYLGINVTLTNRRKVYYESRLQESCNNCYMLRVNATKVITEDEKRD